MDFNKGLVESYPELYGGTGGEPNEFTRKWSDYQEIYQLAQGDVRRYDEISKLNMHQCYLYLAFKIDEANELNRRNKKK